MDECIDSSRIHLPVSAAHSSLERAPNDPSAKTIEFLRARLLSERSVSKAAREQAQELAKKILELEQRLEYEVQLRKQLQKARLEILSKYKDELSGHLSFEDLEALEVDESVSEQGSNGNSSLDKENCMDSPKDCSQQLAREKKTLAWFPQRESKVSRQWKSFSQNSFFTSHDMDSPRRSWTGKSVRKIRNKEDRDQDTRPEDGTAINVNYQNNIHCEEMEKILERQSELIEQFEAEEDAQRAWEEKFQQQKMSKENRKIEQATIQATDKISAVTLVIRPEMESEIPSVVESQKLEVEDTVVGAKHKDHKNTQDEFSLGEIGIKSNEVDAGDKSANDKVSETDHKGARENSGTIIQSEVIFTSYASREPTEATAAGNQKSETFNFHLAVSQKEPLNGQLGPKDNISERSVPSCQGLNIPNNEKHHISFMPMESRGRPYGNHNIMQQKFSDDNASKSGTAERNVYSFPWSIYGRDSSENPITEDMLKRAHQLESREPHFDTSVKQHAHNFNVRHASHLRTDPRRQVPHQQRGRQTSVDRVMDALRALQMAKQEIESSQYQYVYNPQLNFDSSQHLRMMDPFVHGVAGQGPAAVTMPPKYVGMEPRHHTNVPHAWGRVGTKPGQTDPMFPPHTTNKR